jgi:hypothetical protein
MDPTDYEHEEGSRGIGSQVIADPMDHWTRCTRPTNETPGKWPGRWHTRMSKLPEWDSTVVAALQIMSRSGCGRLGRNIRRKECGQHGNSVGYPIAGGHNRVLKVGKALPLGTR